MSTAMGNAPELRVVEGARDAIRGAVDGDREAVRALYSRLAPVIWSRVAQFAEGDERHDAAQDVWLTLFADNARLLRGFEAQRGPTLEGYVGGIAARVARQRRRDARAQKRGGDVVSFEPDALDRAPASEDLGERASARQTLRGLEGAVVQRLPERGRQVCRYVFGEGYGPAETAKAMGVELQVVYNWQHRFRTMARAWAAA